MQFVAKNVAKVELDSTSATAARNFARNVSPCVWNLNKRTTRKFLLLHLLKIYHNFVIIEMQSGTLPMMCRVTLTSFKSWLFAAIQKYCPASDIFTALM